MRKVNGPRPWPIRLFAVFFLGAAFLRLVQGLRDTSFMVFELSRWLPYDSVSTDMGIVALNAQFTIACIPVALIWFRASRIARILVGVMVGIRLLTIPPMLAAYLASGHIDPAQPIMLALSAASAALLFTPTANHWIAMRGRREASVFE